MSQSYSKREEEEAVEDEEEAVEEESHGDVGQKSV